MQIFLKNDLQFVRPEWPVPETVRAFVTTRLGGDSLPPYDGLNLAGHVGDNPNQVAANRQAVETALKLPNEPLWLAQEHTVDTIHWQGQAYAKPPVADASWTQQSGQVCCVMTADCLPVLITNRSGTVAAAVHAGWRGLLNGVVANTIRQLPDAPENLLAWIGPAISQRYFEVGADVYDGFVERNADHASYFTAGSQGKWYADLPGLAEFELRGLGVSDVTQSGLCSYHDEELFYSYRRDGQTGRMATLIWLED
ncbi:hypothetical protein AVO42_08820 [Thiomicrospira sp. XS5]|uniref:peptidoglycan editing factor PgeF n=1 Tax=Thiomicrospira sp. XS5 TaxID=1775636 RepID=UPI00074630A4|nr:peptidoglycan editing factor PgeF [Thiomicrospira sp. XS5]KUJ75416.1 hypothetical protein AVO42_08820 [Thiomicrospira sp. XS5]